MKNKRPGQPVGLLDPIHCQAWPVIHPAAAIREVKLPQTHVRYGLVHSLKDMLEVGAHTHG